jgi:hypothetical protein
MKPRLVWYDSMRLLGLSFSLMIMAGALSCGNSSSTPPPTGVLTGNWQISLLRHSNPTLQVYTGFLQQSGNSISGLMILGDGCSGVGPVSGSLSGQNLQLDINEFGQDLTLSGTLPPGGSSPGTLLTGAFSTLGGGCTSFPSTGTWSAVEVQPVSGPFHGTVTLSDGETLLNVTGTLTQGPNTGSSNASLNGTITASGGTAFCSYLSTATITGFISGTSVSLNLFGPDGSLIAQAGGSSGLPATVSINGGSLTGELTFAQISNSCPSETGPLQVTFP